MKDGPTRVLIVEDNPQACEMIERVIRELGCTVIARASDGKTALKLTLDLRPDLILMDIGLPDIDGIEVTRQIQAQCPTPVVILSAHDRKDLVARAGEAGAGAYVVKPPSAPELERAITIARARFNDMKELARLNRQLEAELAERRRAEEELRRERDFVESLIDTAHTIVLVLDLEGRILRLNKYLEDITGYSARDVQGKSWFETFLPAHDRDRIRDLFFGAVAGGPLEGKVVNPILDRAGREHLIEWYNTKLVDASGSLVGVLATGQDVTDRERIEEEKERLHAQLHQAQKMESIGRLAGGIAHDFNNLLTPMIGYAEMALIDLNPADPLYRDFEEIREAAERAKNLTGQLLAFSRRQMLEMKVVNLNKIISSFKKMLQRIIGEDVEIITTLDPDLVNIKGDPPQIQQVLMNLSINARDAMPQGGRLTIETANVTLDASYAKGRPGVEPGQYAMLAVSDTGVGMGRETVDKIFEPFFTTKAPGEGTGLGLATVYGIVKQHGGNIWVYSEPGRGTIFKIYLPQATGDVQPELVIEKQPEMAAGKGTILVVEDETSVRKLACNILKSHGYDVIEAGSSPDALRLAEAHGGPIDLLLTDVVMPQMNGRELYRQIALLRPDLKVLYMSGYTDDVIAHHGVLDAQIEFLQKPFTVDGLVRKVHQMIAGETG
ncbi:MAG: response regulator [Candidatus Hydrogenedentes bacterium]|nr:response regulator [Candidatus Hydrogenedentota bacterium]